MRRRRLTGGPPLQHTIHLHFPPPGKTIKKYEKIRINIAKTIDKQRRLWYNTDVLKIIPYFMYFN